MYDSTRRKWYPHSACCAIPGTDPFCCADTQPAAPSSTHPKPPQRVGTAAHDRSHSRYPTHIASGATTPTPRKRTRKGPRQPQTKRSRKQKRQALAKDLRSRAMAAKPELTGLSPDDAIQEALESAVSLMRLARQEVGKLKKEELFEFSESGRVPHPWIQVEERARNDVAYIAARMMDIGINARRAEAAEAIAELVAPAMTLIFEMLDLTPAQKKLAPKAVKAGFETIEGHGTEIATS